MEYRFVADVHLGKLARMLRMLGWDVLYQNTFSQTDLLHLSQSQNRILLSKNSSFYKSPANPSFFQMLFDNPYDQLQQLDNVYQIFNNAKPFTRCMVCNGLLQSKNKEDVLEQLPQNTAMYYELFWQCEDCKRIYWQGPHFIRMMQTLQYLQDNQPQ